MHPMLKLIGWTIAPLVLSLPIAVLMSEQDGGAIAQTTQERKAEGGRLLQKGRELSEKGQYKAALEPLQQALQIYQQSQDRFGETITLNEIGKVYDGLLDYTRMGEAYQKALVLARASKDFTEEGNALNGVGDIYYYKAEYVKAQESYQQALIIFKATGNQKGEAQSLHNIGNVYSALSEKQKALEFFNQALPLRRAVGDRWGEGATLFNIGFIYSGLGEKQKALEYHNQALALYRAVGNRWGEGATLASIGLVYLELGDFPKVSDYAQQSLAIARELKDHKIEVNSLILLGYSYLSSRNSLKASDYGQQGLAIARQLKDRRSEARFLMLLVATYRLQEAYAQAIDYGQQFVLIAKDLKDRHNESQALFLLGITYRLVGDYPKAINYLQQRLAITRELKKRDQEEQTLGNLGSTYLYMADYTTAINYFQQELAIARELKKSGSESHSLNGLGLAYLQLNNFSKARDYFQQALAIVREQKQQPISLSNPVYDYVQTAGERTLLDNLGLVSYHLGNYSEAIDYQKQGLAIARKIKDLKGEATSLNNLGISLASSGNLAEAETTFLKSIQIVESLRQGLQDSQKVSIADAQRDPYENLQLVLIAEKKIEPALEIAERGRARAFAEQVSKRIQNTDQPIITPIQIDAIKQVARERNATLVEYSQLNIDNPQLFIWVVKPTGEVALRSVYLKPLGQQKLSLANLVEQSRNTIGARGRADVEVAFTPEFLQKQQAEQTRNLKQLHQLLIEPIADLLPKNETDRVIFMPQGELFLVPFPALLNAQNQPLITQHTILTAPSIQTLDLTHKIAQNRPKGDRPTLVVGNPTMPAVTTVIGNPPKKLTQLPGSEREATTIAQQLNTQAITGASARKDTVMQKMQSAGTIHLATHGLLDSFKGDTPGAIALAPNGTNQPNDGLLTSGEIFDLKLNADLVVLSACDTGRGDITGDGVIGLSRSLFVAGVPSVIVSLWKVPDDSTALLMSEFYKNWKDRKLDKAQALRQAMLTTMKTNPNPKDWAAFTLIGEAD